MPTRQEIDKRIKQKERLLKSAKYTGILLMLALAGWGLLDHLSRTVFSPLKVLEKEYTCSHKRCEYSIKIKSKNVTNLAGYVSVIAYKRVSRGEVNTMEVLTRSRLPFTIESNEIKIIHGEIETISKPSQLEIFVGVTN